MLSQPTIENIFLQGGSVKGTAYIGAVRTLMQHIDFNKIKRIAGTSAGSIGAALLAIGYTVDELEQTLRHLNFESFLDSNSRQLLLQFKEEPTTSGLFSATTSHPSDASDSASNLSKAFGLCRGEFFREWLEKKITCKVSGITEQDYNEKKPHYLTFAELHGLVEQDPTRYKDLYVITANVTTQEAEFLSFENAGNVIISDAVRASMSIPIVFEPCHLYEKTRSGRRQPVDEEMLYTDGGITDNYRVDLFDFARYMDEAEDKNVTHKVYNPHTLGLKLASSEKKDYYETKKAVTKHNVRTFIPYVMAIVKTMHHKQTVDFMQANDQQRTIIIDTLDVDTLDFDLSDDKKDKLIQSGSRAVSRYFETRPSRLEAVNVLTLPHKLFLKIAPFFASLTMTTEAGQVRVTNFVLKDNLEACAELLREDDSAEAQQLIVELGLKGVELPEEPASAIGISLRRG